MIFDYGVGNIFSLRIALEEAGFDVTVGSSPLHLRNTDIIVLPGVGNFSAASGKLAPLREEILTQVKGGTPIFGICLGMQIFFHESEEGEGRGLALFQGKNIRLPSFVKVPHMGWNTLSIVRQSTLLEDIKNESCVYFVHSCYPVPTEHDITVAETTYGVVFPSVTERRNVYGTQFHPEKSSESGLKILTNLRKATQR